MPLYLEGDIPATLTHAGPAFSHDSAWWLFKKLDDCVSEDFAARTVRVQEVWAEMEQGFQTAAVEVEAEAEALRSRGEHAEARSRLTQFMASNLDSVLVRLQDLLTDFQNGD
jgi:dipeptidase